MLILHIGLPKTGTTFLQHRIFARAPEVTFVHRVQGGASVALARDFRRYGRAPVVLAPLSRRKLRRALNGLAAGARPVLVSEENISVSPTRFWRGAGATPVGLARRVAALAGGLDPRLAPVRVILGIRRQDQWLASRYAESSRDFPGFDQADFDRRMAAIADAPALDGPHAWLDYGAVRDAFEAALGPGCVHLVPLERLVAAPGATLDALSGFLGGLPLLAPGRPTPAARRPRNRLSEGENRWRLRRDGSPLTLDETLEVRLRRRFAAGNHRLAADLPLGFPP